MTATSQSSDERRPRTLDAVGRLQLLGLFGCTVATVSLVGVRAVSDARDEHASTSVSWLIAIAIGVLAGLIAAMAQGWSWRRRGGQRLIRLSRRTWRTGELPTAALRQGVRRELERCATQLDKQVPLIVLGVIWTINTVLQLASNRAVSSDAGYLLVWALYVGLTVRNVIDRRRRPQLLRMITALRQEPVEWSSAVD